ncbi:MAG: UPF0182 family protein [Pseudonocardia sp.]|nr:UPF0182 family protein [Pseudonocardia sp.]
MRPPVGAPSLSRRTRILLISAGVLVVLLLGGSRLVNFYVDWLWFGEVGFRNVLTTRLFTQVVQFLVIALLVGGLVALTLWIAYRFRPVFVPVSGPEDPVARYRTVVIQRLRLFAVGVPVVIGVIAGLAGQGDWQTVQMFLHATPFNKVDPEFGNDISFYAFTLPFLRLVLTWLFVSVAICFIVALITHYLFGGIRLTGRAGQVSSAARAQLAVLAGVFVLFKAVGYWFDRYDLLYSQRNANFTGATYTDLNAVLPAKIILLIISVICAAAFFAAVFRRNLQIPAVALVMLVISSILVGAAWPAVLQQFVVAPNANEREAPSIQRNIDATRAAFGLTPDKVEIKPYSGTSTATPAQVRSDTATIPNIRLLDPGKLSKTFTQLQQRRNFYGFQDPLDIDRYTVDGRTQDYIVAARELDQSALVGNQTDWINKHLVYTHGNGFVAAPANQVNAALEDTGGQGGLPKFTVSDTQQQGAIPVRQPRIYYGELLNNEYSIVGRADSGDAPREYDSDTQQFTYDGAGGVPIGGLGNRMAFALAYGERNILFNSSINENSKILYNRDPAQRVKDVAPWLTTDNDPYPAVVDGRIKWIVDGYTTLQNYPYAEQVPLGEATADSRLGAQGQQLPDENISYLRNSVKATVDAYDGTIKLYAFDETDPVLQTWEKAFPGTVLPKSAISPSLQSHLRYPEDQFKVQRELMTRYHVDNPAEFFSTVSFWDVPSDPTVQGNTGASQDAQPPYYVLAGLPGGEPGATFQLTSALVSLQRQFLASYMSVDSDPKNYGKITVLQLPSDTQTLGPQQVQAQFLGSPQVSRELNLLRQNQTTIDYGNLLTLPVAGGLLFVEPVYIERAGQDASYPQLARVLVSYGGRVGYDASLPKALDQIFGAGAGAAAAGTTPAPAAPATPAAPAAPGEASEAQVSAANEIRSALDELKAAQQGGDFAKQGEALAALDAAVSKFQSASG